MEVNVQGLTVKLGGKEVLKDLTFTVARGSSTAIVGVSGCGKTTLLRCLAGLIGANSGKIAIDGAPPSALYGTGKLTFLFQEAYLCRHLTVWDNLALVFRVQHKPICKQQLTKQKPTETVPCICGKHVWQG